jgi:hypothetical protein
MVFSGASRRRGDESLGGCVVVNEITEEAQEVGFLRGKWAGFSFEAGEGVRVDIERKAGAFSHRRCGAGCERGQVLRRVVKPSTSSVLPSWASSSQMRVTTHRLRLAMVGDVVAGVCSSL